MQRHIQCVRNMNMSHGGRVRDDSISNERFICITAGVCACGPSGLNNLLDRLNIRCYGLCRGISED